MKNEERIIELLTDMVRGQDKLTGEVSEMKKVISEMNKEISGIKGEIQGMRSEIQKLNLNTSENSRAILKL